MPLTPGVSELVTLGGSAAAPNTPNGKIFSTTSTVKSVTINPFGPVEAGRPTPSGGVKLKASAGSSIGTVTA